MSLEGETLPVGMWAGCVRCGAFGTVCIWVRAYYLSISHSVPCSMFCVYKREVFFFLIYSKIILVMTQICNKSHQCYVDVSVPFVTVLECLLGSHGSGPL
jgi:hypothetical protein